MGYNVIWYKDNQPDWAKIDSGEADLDDFSPEELGSEKADSYDEAKEIADRHGSLGDDPDEYAYVYKDGEDEWVYESWNPRHV